MAGDGDDTDIVLTFGQVVEEFDGIELRESQSSRLIVPSKGELFDEDGNGRLAVIRPCVSRGKRVRGLPPVYTPTMLEESARVFTGWPMYMDHLAEQALAEMAEWLEDNGHEDLAMSLQESRSVKELGGRILRSFWNPDMVFEDDEEFGFQRGGVEAVYRPQPDARRMLEADPGILQASINAWPKGARSGAVPWDTSQRGMLIEGIRSKPMGSVDFVFKAGAGGRPLPAVRERAVSLLESYYDAPQRTMPTKKIDITADLTSEQLREQLEEAGAGHLVAALAPARGNGDDKDNGSGDALTEERVEALAERVVTKAVEGFTEQLEEATTAAKDAADTTLQERAELTELEKVADDLLAEAVKNGLPDEWRGEIRKRYMVLPSGASSGLLVEAVTDEAGTVTKSRRDVLTERVTADVKHAAKLIEASGGTARVKGLGATAKDENAENDDDVAEQIDPSESVLAESLVEWGVDLAGKDKAEAGKAAA